MLAAVGLAGCRSASPAGGVGAAPGPPAAVETKSVDEHPDHATNLAEWVEAHQKNETLDNHWPEFVDVTTRIRGAWEMFLATDPTLSAYLAANPDENWPVTRPRTIIRDPKYAEFEPALRGFFEGLARSGLLEQMDNLCAPARFVALRATEPLMSMPTPELGATRIVAELCEARIRFMLSDGKPDQAARSLAHGLAIVRASQGRGTLMGYLLSSAQVNIETEMGVDLMQGRVDAAAAGSMLAVLTDSPPVDLRVAIGGERFIALDTIDRFFEQVKAEAAHTDSQRKLVDEGLHLMASRAEQTALANRFFDGCQVLLSADAGESARGRAEVDAVNAVAEGEHTLKMYKPVSMLLLNIDHLEKTMKTQAVRHEGLRAMLALEVFRGRAGHYPESLEELAPGDLAVLPVDPFARGGGLKYRRTLAEGGTAETGYMLYSVGADGEDNGGKEHATTAGNAFGPPRVSRGYDYLINKRRW